MIDKMMIGKIVHVLPCDTNDEADLLCAGFNAKVLDIKGNKAWIDSDAFTRETGTVQAVSFKQWWPVDRLKISLMYCPICKQEIDRDLPPDGCRDPDCPYA